MALVIWFFLIDGRARPGIGWKLMERRKRKDKKKKEGEKREPSMLGTEALILNMMNKL